MPKKYCEKVFNEKEKVGIVNSYYFASVFSIKDGFWTEMKKIKIQEAEKFIKYKSQFILHIYQV